MKLKPYGAMLASLLLAVSLAACSAAGPINTDPTSEPTDPTSAPDTEPVVLSPVEPTDEPSPKPTDEPAAGPTDASGDGQTGVPNPRTDYLSVAELNGVLGFSAIELDPEAGYTAAAYSAINGNIGEILYRADGGAELCLRTARASEDMDAEALSGVYGVTFTDRSTGTLQVFSGEHDGTFVLWFSDGTTACSLTAEGVSEQEFEDICARLLPTG